MEVVEFEPDKAFGMVINDGPIEMHSRMTFEPEGAQATRISASLDVPSMADPMDPAPIQQSMRRMGADRIRADPGSLMTTARRRYRWRTWLRRPTPRAVADRVPRGSADCGDHEWYNHDDVVDHCYHCTVGVRARNVGAPRDSPRIGRSARWLRSSKKTREAAAPQRVSASRVRVGRFFTPDAISSNHVAVEQLAMTGTELRPVVGYFDMPGSLLPSEPLATFGPRLVAPKEGLMGAGTEIEVSELYGDLLVPTSEITLVRQ